MKTLSPTGSYEIDLPDDVLEEIDDRVVSYWLENDNVLLQVSSYKRDEGHQIDAKARLEARLSREKLFNWKNEAIGPDDCLDVASASANDDQGYHWIYCYAVWSDLTVLATISAERNDFDIRSKWAIEALRSLRRI